MYRLCAHCEVDFDHQGLIIKVAEEAEEAYAEELRETTQTRCTQCHKIVKIHSIHFLLGQTTVKVKALLSLSK